MVASGLTDVIPPGFRNGITSLGLHRVFMTSHEVLCLRRATTDSMTRYKLDGVTLQKLVCSSGTSSRWQFSQARSRHILAHKAIIVISPMIRTARRSGKGCVQVIRHPSTSPSLRTSSLNRLATAPPVRIRDFPAPRCGAIWCWQRSRVID